ncbi:hemolysin III family protein [Sulfitobacter sp. PS-8MA]|uniref:PAQR family membrane homeostasis protein TrhA n=1 Tax=Sulfitobacter sp. PS-8MA TaxID=3237707 RepID=UPI0034C68C67
MAYPTSKAETLADGTVHALSLCFAIPASILLLLHASGQEKALTAITIYAACLLASFTASAVYHLLPFDRSRAFLGRLDHAAIYFKIAGTYTPLVMVIGSGFAYGILGVVWALAVIGAVAKLWFWQTDARGSLALYLGMGWLSVLLIYPMWHNLPGAALALVAAGGLTYSAGTLVYAHPGMRYQNAIWHVFVLIATACFFAAIALSV